MRKLYNLFRIKEIGFELQPRIADVRAEELGSLVEQVTTCFQPIPPHRVTLMGAHSSEAVLVQRDDWLGI